MLPTLYHMVIIVERRVHMFTNIMEQIILDIDL